MSAKSQLKRSLYNVLSHDKSGSFATRYDRKNILSRFVKDLFSINYKISNIHDLKQKHIIAIVDCWKQRQLSNATIKNRLAVIRYLSGLLDKSQLVPTNKELNLAPRKYVSTQNRAIQDPDFSRINNFNIRVSLELQRVFGLRREESLKIKPHLADKNDRLELLPSWCKGGRGRVIPIYTEEQRYWLNCAKEVVGKFGDSLIPKERNYIQQRWIYEKQTLRAGLSNLHGLRHAYAQRRYKELTGWDAPISGGLRSTELTPEQRELDYQARMILTEELGHSREQITVNYLGR